MSLPASAVGTLTVRRFARLQYSCITECPLMLSLLRRHGPHLVPLPSTKYGKVKYGCPPAPPPSGQEPGPRSLCSQFFSGVCILRDSVGRGHLKHHLCWSIGMKYNLSYISNYSYENYRHESQMTVGADQSFRIVVVSHEDSKGTVTPNL